MEHLLLEFQIKINRVSLDIQRYLVPEIDLNNRLIAVIFDISRGLELLLNFSFIPHSILNLNILHFSKRLTN